MKIIQSIPLFVLLIGIGGCAPRSDVRMLEDRVIALERRNLELQQQTAAAEQEKSQLRSQLQNYGTTLEEKEQVLRSQSAGLTATLDRIRNELQAVRGKLEEANYQTDQRLRAIEGTVAANSNRLETIEQQLGIESSRGQGGRPGAAYRPSAGSSTDRSGSAPARNRPAPQPSASPASENDLYLQAKQSFDRGDFEAALEGFRNLLRNYPDAQYADNAQFWIGEIFYRQQQYENAILEYQTVIEKFPRGNKVRASLLKQGFAFSNLGDRANARLILQDLIDKYPDSSESKIARQKLNAL
jgi:tol-pal system protein YbgF